MLVSLFNQLFPQHCFSCNVKINQKQTQIDLLCNTCLLDIAAINSYCIHCFRPLSNHRFLCLNCRVTEQSPIDQIFILFDYQHPQIKSMISHLKFNRKPFIAKIIAQLISQHFGLMLNQMQDYHLLPIPSDRLHYAWRGFNPTAQIIKFLMNTNPLPNQKQILKKRAFYKPQSSLTRQERLDNLDNAFILSQTVTSEKILLFDDVYTTGKTIHTVAQQLKENGAKNITALITAKA